MSTIQELKENFVVTGLERRLKEDKSGAEMYRIENQLALRVAEVEAHKRSGLPPAEYFQVDRLLASLRVAEQVVRRAWNGYHAH